MSFIETLKRGIAQSTVTMSIPIFPLKAVLFPGSILPLRIFEQRYMDMVKSCLQEHTLFGVCLIKKGEEVGTETPVEPEQIGCLARIIDWDMQQLGVLNLKTEGGQRFQIASSEAAQSGLITATVTLIPPEPKLELASDYQPCVTVLEKIIEQVGVDHFQIDRDLTDASWVSYRLAEVLPIKLSIKQKMLEINDSTIRLQLLQKFLIQQGLVAR